MKYRNILLISIAIAAALLILPHIYLYLFGLNLLPGAQAYHILAQADSTGKKALTDLPLFSVGKIIGIELSARVLPFVIGLVLAILAYFIQKKLGFNKKTLIAGMFFLIYSPVYLYSGIVYNEYTYALLFILAGFFFLLQDGYLQHISAIMFALACYIDYTLALLLIPLALYIGIGSITYAENFVLGFSSAVISMLRDNGICQFGYDTKNYLVVLGANPGITLFMLLLAGLAIIATWRNKRQLVPLYLLIFLVTISSVYIKAEHIALLSLVLVFLAAQGFMTLLNMDWEIVEIRRMLKYIIVIGTVMTGILYMQLIVDSAPHQEMIESLKYLKAENAGNILAVPDDSVWIEYFSGHDTFIDPCDPDHESKLNTTIPIISQRSEEETVSFFTQNNITHVLSDAELRGMMQDDLGNIGLEFVMRNSHCFVSDSRFGPIIIWEFMCSPEKI